MARRNDCFDCDTRLKRATSFSLRSSAKCAQENVTCSFSALTTLWRSAALFHHETMTVWASPNREQQSSKSNFLGVFEGNLAISLRTSQE